METMNTDAILTMEMQPKIEPNHTTDAQWLAVLNRDANRDEEFVFAVSSTGVYCRPSCPSRRPRRGNVIFFSKPQESEHAGYPACLRGRPHGTGSRPKQVVR